MDIGLFLGDLCPFLHEGDAGGFKFLVLLPQFRPRGFGLFAGDFQGALIGFVLSVQPSAYFFLSRSTVLGGLAGLLSIMLQMLTR